MNMYQDALSILNLSGRVEQEGLFKSISEQLRDDGVAVLAQASTGVGKTLSVACAASQLVYDNAFEKPLVVIVAPTIALCREYMGLFESIGVDAGFLLSYRNYFCKEKLRLLAGDCTHLPESKSPIETMINWSGAIDEYINEYGELPLGLAQSQVCQSSYSVSDEYSLSRERAMRKNIIVTTHAMLAADVAQSGRVLQLSEHSTKMIVDEADAFIDTLRDFQQQHFNIIREFSKIRPLTTATFHDKLDTTIEYLRTKVSPGVDFSQKAKLEAIKCLEDLYNAMKGRKKRNLGKDDSRMLADFKDYLRWLIFDLGISEQVSFGLTKVNKEPTIAIYSPYFSRMFGAYLESNGISVACVSGTLSVDPDVMPGTEWVVKELKLDTQRIAKFEFSPSKFGDLSLNITRILEDVYDHDGSDEDVKLSELWVKSVANRIESTKGKTLVVTASFKEAELLGHALGQNALVHKAGEKLSPLKSKFIDSNDAQILISPSAHTGINFTDKNNRSVLDSIVITRLGFPPQNEVLRNIKSSKDFPEEKIRALKIREYHLNMNRIIRRSIQILGRGIRHEDDTIELHVLDNRFPTYTQVGGKYSKLKAVIPKRFSENYRKANIIEPLSQSYEKDTDGIDLSLIC